MHITAMRIAAFFTHMCAQGEASALPASAHQFLAPFQTAAADADTFTLLGMHAACYSACVLANQQQHQQPSGGPTMHAVRRRRCMHSVCCTLSGRGLTCAHDGVAFAGAGEKLLVFRRSEGGDAFFALSQQRVLGLAVLQVKGGEGKGGRVVLCEGSGRTSGCWGSKWGFKFTSSGSGIGLRLESQFS